MRVQRLGDGPPEVAVVAAIHGDEPGGVRAVERFLDAEPEVSRPVALVVANEEALEREVRYVDTDLNRAFPGDPDGTAHETRLAAALARELSECATLAPHSTQSYEDPFAIVRSVGGFERRTCPHLSVDAVVETEAFDEGRIFASVPRTVEVECGYQGSDAAAENALTLLREFLGATGVLPDERAPARELPVYRLVAPIPKNGADPYEVFASNFRRVAPGEVYATADGRELVAEEAFYPVLLSAYGYDEVFGYAAERVGTIDADG